MPMSPEKNSSTPPFVPFPSESSAADPSGATPVEPRGEIGGPSGPEPTRFGDWERKGRCIDF
jgi:hypothetical protein